MLAAQMAAVHVLPGEHPDTQNSGKTVQITATIRAFVNKLGMHRRCYIVA